MAEMMPEVIVPRSWMPSGSPMATTESPTRSESESPNSAAVRPSASIRKTARSLMVSLPMSSAGYCWSSCVRTLSCPAPSMTWWFVMI